MHQRAAAFAPTASWLWVIVTPAVLWFGFIAIFGLAFTIWADSIGVETAIARIDAFTQGSTPAAVRWTLASFAIYIALLWLVLRVVHKLRLAALLGPVRVAAWQFGRVSLYLAPFYAVSLGVTLMTPEIQAQASLGSWLWLLPGTLALIFVQIGAEELVFRGYLQSHLAALVSHRVIYIGVPSILFGLIHYDGTSPPDAAWAYVVWASAFGLVCADLTARSGTLGPALALHLVNNTAAILILATDNWLYGAALYVWPMNGEPWQPWWPYEGLVLLILWLIARLAVRR